MSVPYFLNWYNIGYMGYRTSLANCYIRMPILWIRQCQKVTPHIRYPDCICCEIISGEMGVVDGRSFQPASRSSQARFAYLVKLEPLVDMAKLFVRVRKVAPSPLSHQGCRLIGAKVLDFRATRNDGSNFKIIRPIGKFRGFVTLF